MCSDVVGCKTSLTLAREPQQRQQAFVEDRAFLDGGVSGVVDPRQKRAA